MMLAGFIHEKASNKALVKQDMTGRIEVQYESPIRHNRISLKKVQRNWRR